MALTAPGSGRSVFLRSFTVAVSNPKGYIFFLALLPMFMDVKANALPQYLSLLRLPQSTRWSCLHMRVLAPSALLTLRKLRLHLVRTVAAA